MLLEKAEGHLFFSEEMAYALMAFAQRRQLHRAVAEWLGQTHADNLTPFYPLLADHWRQALDEQHPDPDITAKAMDYLSKADEQALDNFANQEATHAYKSLLLANWYSEELVLFVNAGLSSANLAE